MPLTRISLTDRPWLPYRGLLSIGPVQTPAVDAIRAGLRAVVEAYPDHPLVSRLDEAALRWCRVPASEVEAHLAALVSASDEEVDAESLERRLPPWLEDFDDSLPFKVLVGPRCLTLMTSHALGDGRADFALLERLLRAGQPASTMLDLAGPSSDRSTARVLADFYGRRPGRVIKTLRSPRPNPRQTGGVETVEGAVTRPLFVYRRIDRPTWSAIRAWRAEHCPAASVAAVLFSLTGQAFAATDLGVDPAGFYMLVDNRRYLRGRSPLSGNLAKSVYVRPDDMADPASVNRTIRETVESGRTLASTALSAVSAERRRRRFEKTGQLSGWQPSRDIVLSLTYLSQMESFESLPWLGGDGERWLGGCGTTGSPSGITVFYADVHGELHLSVSFLPDRIDERAVRSALTALQAGPLAGI